ncbi:MAG: flagellar basal body P-ring formation chaperone FlgA [Neptuniibacter sp.]
MNTLNLTRLFLLTTLLFYPITSSATNQVELLEQQALNFLSVHYNKVKPDVRTEIKINPISRGLKLRSCQESIQFQLPKGNGNRITLRARCSSPKWQIFITAHINQFTEAIISQHSLPKKFILNAKDLILTEVDVTNLRSGFFTAKTDIIGWSTKRNIPQGVIITANMLKPPMAIKKGYSVVIEAIRNGITIKATGTALEDGEIGKQIQVKNDRSGKIIKAQVIRPGLVRTP